MGFLKDFRILQIQSGAQLNKRKQLRLTAGLNSRVTPTIFDVSRSLLDFFCVLTNL